MTSNFPRWEGDSTTPFVLNLAKDLQKLGWRIDVLAPHASGTKSREILGGINVERFRYLWPESLETVCYGGGALINLRKNKWNVVKVVPLVFFEWAAIARRLATRKYDLLHSHWILPQGFTGIFTARPLNIPHVVTAHGGDVFSLQGDMLARFKKFTLHGADAVTVNSSATRKAVAEIAPNLTTIHTIPMGVSQPAPDPASVARIRRRYRREEEPLILFVGRLVHEKGVDDLIRAIAVLSARNSDATAIIVGEGQDRSELEALAQTLGVQERIVFTGWVQPDEVVNYFSAADIFAGPSKRAPSGWIEAQGLTFIEAMLVGTPVIATRTGGIVDSVRHEETGLLVDESAPEQIAAAVTRLVSDPTLCERLTKSAAQLARDRFTRDTSAEAFSKLFSDMIDRHGVTSNSVMH